jgi:small subunit ribosomal protein S6
MSDNKYIYQAMFLLDNGEVREQGFNAAREWVKATLEKHGATVKVLRLWGERPLAYPIAGRSRATYVLGWMEASQETVNKAKREMYLLGPVFRVLFLHENQIPAEELAMGIEDVRDEDIVIPEDVEEVDEFFAEEAEEETEAKPEAAPAEKAEPKKAEASSAEPVAADAGDAAAKTATPEN